VSEQSGADTYTKSKIDIIKSSASWKNSSKSLIIKFETFEDIIDRCDDGCDRQGRCTPEVLFEWSGECEIPSYAMKTSKNEDDHPRVPVAVRSWGIEGRDT